MPSWIGDAVMATPTLRALKNLWPQVHVSVLAREPVRPVLDACPWIDRILTVRHPRKGMADTRRVGPFPLAARLAAGKFDTAVLLPNSFRTALLARMAGIPRRIGYDRDGRGFLLTDRLLPMRTMGKYVPVPTRDYYLGISRYLGSVNPDPTMQLFTRPEDDRRAEDLLRSAGFDTQHGRLVLLNPGANYGEAKMWAPERFAAVAQKCATEFGATIAVTGAPKERAILERLIASTKTPVLDLPKLGVDLSILKSIIRRASLMITNDTGPRHMAAALGVPVVTVFGPTDPAWTEIEFALERKVRVDLDCSPCQKKICPLKNTPDDHRCMKDVTPDMVFHEASALLRLASTPA